MSGGFSSQVRRVIRDRADNRCEKCGLGVGHHAHHRRVRGMGGDKRETSNHVANGLWVCQRCHDDIHAHPARSIEHGWLLSQTTAPATAPVLYRGAWVTLDDRGNLEVAS